MKRFKKLFTLLIIFALILTIPNPGLAKGKVKSTVGEDGRVTITMEFEDSNQARWAMEYIAKMQSMNIFTGYNDGTFRPNQPVTRAEAIITAVRLMGLGEEAKAKDPETNLYFKDAKLLDGKYSWAKGHVIVALENGLFDTNMDKLQPDKPASRLWVAGLLIKALGLEEEALANMTAPLDFKDAASIPAGSVGYVSVAVDRGIVTGYHDGSFKPNKNVTRAEMAALLARTNDEMLEESGVITVTGKIKEISFEQSADNNSTVTENVYGEMYNGQITLETFNGTSASYLISSELLVQHNTLFLPADQLQVNDVVTVDVEDNVVIEAALIDQDSIIDALAGINEFNLKIEYSEEKEYKLRYKNSDGKPKAEVKYEDGEQEEKLTGEEALEQVISFIEGLDLTPDLTDEQIKEIILDALGVTDFNKLEIEILFANGKKVKVKIENEDEEEENEVIEEGITGLNELELKFETRTEEITWNYNYEDGKVNAEIKNESEHNKAETKGDLAKAAIEDLFLNLVLNEDVSEDELLEQILNHLELNSEDIVKAEINIELSDGSIYEVDFEEVDEEVDEDENQDEES